MVSQYYPPLLQAHSLSTEVTSGNLKIQHPLLYTSIFTFSSSKSLTLKLGHATLAGVALFVGALSNKPQGCGLDYQSGHIQEATNVVSLTSMTLRTSVSLLSHL